MLDDLFENWIIWVGLFGVVVLVVILLTLVVFYCRVKRSYQRLIEYRESSDSV